MAKQDDSEAQVDSPENSGAMTFDADATARLLGLTKRQKLWCLATLRGANKTQAAREAGYQGDGEQIRQAGFRVSKSAPVERFMELAALEGGGVADGPVDYAELKRIMSKHARGSDKSASINACNALAKIHEREAEDARTRAESSDPIEALFAIANLGADCLVIARGLAREEGLLETFEKAWEFRVRTTQSVAGNVNGGAMPFLRSPTHGADQLTNEAVHD